MNKNDEPKTKAPSPTDTDTILQKMQYQLDCMERKIDSLVKQTAPRDFKSKYPAKPQRKFDDKKRPFKAKHVKRKEGTKTPKGFYTEILSGEKKSSSKSHFRNKKKALKKAKELSE